MLQRVSGTDRGFFRSHLTKWTRISHNRSPLLHFRCQKCLLKTGKLQSGLTSSVAKSSDSDAYVNLSLCIHILLICSLVHCSPSILSHRNDLYVIGNGFHMPPTNMLTAWYPQRSGTLSQSLYLEHPGIQFASAHTTWPSLGPLD